jgi:malic enzyme
MKKILFVGAGACGLAISRVLSAQKLSIDDVVIVTPENISQHKEEIMAQSQFLPEPIMIKAQQKFDDISISIPRNEKPFWQTIKKNKNKKR